jgi:hypothetical protein
MFLFIGFTDLGLIVVDWAFFSLLTVFSVENQKKQ